MAEKQKVETTTDDFVNDEDRLDKYKLDINNDADDQADQRDKANADFRFINVPGGMWEDWNEQEFTNRTKMEFDQISDFKNRFMGEWDNNRVDVVYKPDDHKTSDDDAELLNGIYRADVRDENGKISVDNAVDEMAICGYGCAKLGTKFIDEDDAENEFQRVDFRPIYNAFNMVYWDRAAQWINKRDARRCTLLEPFTPDGFKEIYGEDESAVSAYEPHTRSYNDFTVRSKTVIYIATRYEIVRKKTKFFIYSNLQTSEIEAYAEDEHKLIEGELKASKHHKRIRTRVMIRQTVEKSIFTGDKFLQKPTRIVGKFIPIIPFYAYRSYVDGTERYHGLVRKLMDPQRLLNVQISQLAENAASNGQEMPIFDPDQMPPNIANLWANRNNKPYMLAKTLVNEQTGEVIQHGPSSYLKAPSMDANAATLLTLTLEHIRGQTGGAPQDTLNPDASGKAIRALQKRENLKTATVMDNIARSIEWMGEVYQSIASEIYDSQRMMRIIGMDGAQRQIQIFKEVMDSDTGLIVRANNLSGKRFRAYADVGPAFDTLREQTVEDIKGMMELLISAGASGEKYIPILTSMMLENINGVGLSDLKDLVRRDMILQGIKKPETDEEKALLEQARQPKADPQAELIKAAADQASSEGAKFRSEARNLDSKSIDNVASARKKAAETRKILAEIGLSKQGVLKDLLSMTLRRAEKLPFPGRRSQI